MNLKKYVYSIVGNMDKYIQTRVTRTRSRFPTLSYQRKTQSDAHTITRSYSITTSWIKPSTNSTILNSRSIPPRPLQNSGAMASPQSELLRNNPRLIRRVTSLRRLQAISAIRTILKSTKKEKYTR